MGGKALHGAPVWNSEEGSFVDHLVDDVEVAYHAIHCLEVSTKANEKNDIVQSDTSPDSARQEVNKC